MKIAALIFGILGALSALSYAVYGYAIGSIFLAVSNGGYGGMWEALSVIIALMCIVGAGSVWAAPLFGGIVLLVSAVVIMIVAGINFLSFSTLLLLGAGGGFALGAYGSEQSQRATSADSANSSRSPTSASEPHLEWGRATPDQARKTFK